MIAAIVAVLVVAGLWPLAVVVLAVGPAFYAFNRYPYASILVWLLADPILMVGEGGVGRMIYWLIHRALPVGTLLLIVVARLIGVRKERFPRLGWPEALMGGYLVLTVMSILYRSLDTTGTLIYMYDHVLVPMSIYMLVRLLAPDEDDLRRMVPVVVVFVVVQSLVGMLSLVAPGVLPSSWINREARTTGTLRHPNVFSVAVLFGGLYLAHYGQTVARRPWVRRTMTVLMGVAIAMAIASLSRAAWLAALVVIAGLFVLYRKVFRRLAATGALIAVVAVMVGGVFTTTGDVLSQRLYSDTSAESALSRLPVVLASLRMIERRPLIGWGYENFDRYDHAFTGSIDGLFVPDKDHASHNLFLTLGAESGFVGLGLYLGPALWWLVRSRSGVGHLPTTGFRSRKLVWMLWLAMAAQVVVYNFSNNRVAFGLGLWWLVLGLIATICDWDRKAIADAEEDVQHRIHRLTGAAPPAIGPVESP